MRRALGGALAAVLLCGACASSNDLAIDLRTDLEPGIDFVAYRLTLISEVGTDPIDVVERDAEAGRSWLAGARAGYFMALPPGEYWVAVALLDQASAIVAERLVLVNIENPRVTTVLITHSCRDIECPRAGDPPMAVACNGGQCVLPDCTPETPQMCPEPECVTDADCDGGGLCGEGTCAADVCWFAPGPSACADGQHCRPEIGCAICDQNGCEPADAP